MSLIQQEPIMATGMDLTIEQQILTQLNGLERQVREFRYSMMGDGQGETPHGRMPIVEDKLKDHEERIGALETARIETRVYTKVFGIVGGFVGGVVGASVPVVLEILFRHGGH